MPNLVLASLFVLLWLSLRALASEGSVPGGLRQRRSAEDEKIPPVTQDWMCRLTVIGTMLERTGHNGELRTEGVEEYGCIPYEHGQETNQLIPITLPESFVTNHQEEIAYGRLIVLIHGASLVDDEVLVADQATFEVQEASHIERHLAATTGTLSLYVVRVSTPDATPSKTLSQLLQGIFSTSAVSFKSQYEACSFRKLSWKSAGGIDVKLDNKISSYSKPSQLVEAAVAKVEKATGRTISSLGNKVVFCQPPGLGGWIAVGVVNSWRVNINDGFCLSLSTLMHEVGHTLGLLHSGESGEEYADETGFMGYGYRSETSPQKCFNGYKNYQLGWYSDRVWSINPSSPKKVKLATFVDYPKAASDEPVVLNIGDQYFVQYNRAKGMNSETKEKQNLVTVTEKTSTTSWLVAGLGAGQQFTKSNFKGTGQTLVVAVCQRKDGGGTKGADLMVVSIGYGKSYC